jgi:hypothetical protein
MTAPSKLASELTTTVSNSERGLRQPVTRRDREQRTRVAAIAIGQRHRNKGMADSQNLWLRSVIEYPARLLLDRIPFVSVWRLS